MKIITTVKRIERIDQLIRLKATGTPQNLANRLDISESCLFRIIRTMRLLGAPIYFCHDRNSYCYSDDVTFSFGFKKKKC